MLLLRLRETSDRHTYDIRFSIEVSTGLLRTDCRNVVRPGVIAAVEDGISFDFQIL